MEDRQAGVYCIKNTASDRYYIGSAKILSERWRLHKHFLRKGTHPNFHLQQAWNKYGEAAFEFCVLEYVDVPEKLMDAEQSHLDYHFTMGRLYNVCPTAGNRLHVKHTDEAKRKMSETKRGRPSSKKGIPSGRKGEKQGPHTEERKRHISEAKIGRACPKGAQARSFWWAVTFPDGHTENVKNLRSFCRINQLNAGHMSTVGTRGYKAFKLPLGRTLLIDCDQGSSISTDCIQRALES